MRKFTINVLCATVVLAMVLSASSSMFASSSQGSYAPDMVGNYADTTDIGTYLTNNPEIANRIGQQKWISRMRL